ncbi:MAG TPA: metalloregulator ArsR/SmtB family transcription factor [Candidatus Binataceae bacterium]|nr:metalloregulator ArsR/SmtB family transcription factor [Candidatus Binataceae bacterium]
MTDRDTAALLRHFKALGNESRLKLVGLIADRERNVQELAALLALKEPTVSHHLAILKDAGLLALRLDGNTHWYRLDHDALNRINRSVFSTDLARVPYEVDGEVWEREVLQNFLEGDRLSKIPDARKKRWAILKWLARRFAVDSRYTEAEVNAVIKRHHPDAATLRREMVGYGMLERGKGIYRRTPESTWKSF